MPDIVIVEFIHADAVDALKCDFDVHYDNTLVHNPDKLPALLAEARGLIVGNLTRVNDELMDLAPNLKAVGRLGVGTERIDLDACEHRGIPVFPAFGANHVAVAEYTIGSMIALLRGGAFQVSELILAGKFPRRDLKGHEAFEKRFGIIGLGRIGKAVATRAKAFDMNVVANDPYLADDDPAWDLVDERVDFETLLETSDVVGFHAPYRDETHHLIDTAAVARMKPGAILINPARGGVIDEIAVAEGVKSGHLFGAAIDVFSTEPVTVESAAHFLDTPNLILSPHVAGVTEETNRRIGIVTAERVKGAILSSH